MLQQLPKELQDLVSELIEEAEFKGKQVMAACTLDSVQQAWSGRSYNSDSWRMLTRLQLGQ